MAELEDGAATWRAIADRVLGGLAEAMARHAAAFGQLLQAADMAVHGGTRLVLAGDPEAAALQQLAHAAAQPFVPALVVTGGTTTGFSGMAAYICRHSTCGLPATTPEAVTAQLLG